MKKLVILLLILTASILSKDYFMRNLRSIFVFCIALSLLIFPITSYSKPAPGKSEIMVKAAKLQIPFIENQGQIKEKSVRFFANTFAGNVYVTDKGEIVYSLQKAVNSRQKADVVAEPRSVNLPKSRNRSSDLLIKKTNPPEGVFLQKTTNDKPRVTRLAILKETLIGSKSTKPQGNDKAPTKVNYFVGDKKNWKTNIQSYNEVSLGEVYNGIELKLKAYGKNVEKLFVVNPKGKAEDIKLNFEGGKKIRVNDTGELEIVTELGNVKFTKPYAYQEIDGKRFEVGCKFQISSLKSQVRNFQSETLNPKPETRAEQRTTVYGFTLASYNKNYPLIIDPLLASTFLGATLCHFGTSMAIDSTGNIFVTGYTNRSDFPVTPNAYNTSHKNNRDDIFISKLDNSLNHLLASTLIGGTDFEESLSITIDSKNNIIITGSTYSTDYPTTKNAYKKSDNRVIDSLYSYAFVSKLNNSLSTLLYSTLIGGGGPDKGNAVAIDSKGNIFVTGVAGPNFSTTKMAYDTLHNGSLDVFLSKFDSTLTTLLASTYIGGKNVDEGYSLAIDSKDNVFVTGRTESPTYPITKQSYTRNKSYSWNRNGGVFVSKFNNNLSTLLASTIIGGNKGNSIAIDSKGNIFITGETSYGTNYPTTPGAYNSSKKGWEDIFISKFNETLSTLLASAIISGSQEDKDPSIAIDSKDNIFVTGWTYSSDFPTTSKAYNTSYNGTGRFRNLGGDVFISKFNNNLGALLSSTFIGGSSNDEGNSIAIDSKGNIFVTGRTYSSDYPTTQNAIDTSYSGDAEGTSDIFISKLDNNLSANPGSQKKSSGTTTTISVTTTSTINSQSKTKIINQGI